MKFAVVASAAMMAVANAGDCPLLELVPIANGPKGTQCTAETGYNPVSLQFPDAATLAKLCASSVCRSMLVDIKAKAPRGCTVSGTLDLYKDVIDPIEAKCGAPSSTTPAPTTAKTTPGATTPAPTTTKPGATTTTPSTTTKAPTTGSGSGSKTTEAPTTTPETTTAEPITSGGSASQASETITPKPTTTTPAPTKSSATKVMAAAGAVVAAIAASFF